MAETMASIADDETSNGLIRIQVAGMTISIQNLGASRKANYITSK